MTMFTSDEQKVILHTIYTIGLAVSILLISCREDGKHIDTIDYLAFYGEPVNAFMEQLSELYGPYKEYEYIYASSMLQGCEFRYFDSAYVRIFDVYVNWNDFQFVPKILPADSSYGFPDLSLFKKEKTGEIVAHQLTHEEYNDYLSKRRKILGLDSSTNSR